MKEVLLLLSLFVLPNLAFGGDYHRHEMDPRCSKPDIFPTTIVCGDGKHDKFCGPYDTKWKYFGNKAEVNYRFTTRGLREGVINLNGFGCEAGFDCNYVLEGSRFDQNRCCWFYYNYSDSKKGMQDVYVGFYLDNPY